MKNKVAQSFYSSLAKGKGEKYLIEARRFIPRYNEIAKEVVMLLQIYNPTNILDIGSGIGNIEKNIFKKLPKTEIICVEISPEMARTSRLNLKQFGNRAKIVNKDILDFEADDRYDAIFSNIALHNIPYGKKKLLIKNIKKWLNYCGIFIWSDLIKYSDDIVQNKIIAQRLKNALKKGATKKFAEENFEKEGKFDYPLGVNQTLNLLKETGFSKSEIVWLYGAFAIFYAQK